MPENSKKLNLVIDIDGVMTTGQFLYSKRGKEYKIFGPHDAEGLKIIKDKINILFVSTDTRGFAISKKRIDDMGYNIIYIKDGERYDWIKKNLGFANTIFIGDSMNDAPIIRDCLFGIAPANARIEARNWAKYITPSRSAEGAVCDACIKINKVFFRSEKSF